MRKLVVVVLGLLALVSCQSPKNQLKAEVDNVADGSKVIISEMVNGNQAIPIDSANVQGGKFMIDLPAVDFQTLNSLTIEGVNGSMLFINENKPLTATIYKDSMGTSVIEGGEANHLLTRYLTDLNENNRMVMNEIEKYSPEELQDPEVINVIRAKQEEMEIENTNYRKKYIQQHPKTLSTIFVFVDMMNSGQVDDEEMRTLYEGLSDELKSTYFGGAIAEELERKKALSIGMLAPEFSGTNPDGKEISLKDVLAEEGEYTLIEFWASWCPYCQQELPNVVEVYKDFKDKGFKVFGVSIDEEKEEWTEAIESWDMEWDHISSLKRWDEPIVHQYKVQSIPYNYLVDSQGKIVARDLQGDDLRKKIEELLDSEN